METVVQPPADAELHLLTDWSDAAGRGRTRTAGIVSVLVHAVILGTVVLVPASVSTPPVREVHRIVTPLIEPLTELTQKAPNVGKVNKEFSAAVAPRPHIQSPAPSPPPSVARPAPAKPLAIPAPPKPTPPTPQPEPPKVEGAVKQPANVDLSKLATAPPPQIQPEEKPKITFENVPPPPGPPVAGRSQVPIPGSSLSDITHGGGRGGLGGDGAGGAQGGVGGINLPPIPGSQGSNVLPQLLSDSMGVDFVPYLRQILVTVRRNWLAVIPESVKYGNRRGVSGIQFSIGKDGKVIKLVIESASGSEALDRAAVAGISASNPFPPLPAEFKGDRIVVQFNFQYNMPRR